MHIIGQNIRCLVNAYHMANEKKQIGALAEIDRANRARNFALGSKLTRIFERVGFPMQRLEKLAEL